MVQVDLGDRDHIPDQQILTITSAEFDGTGDLGTYDETTYSAAGGLMQVLVVDGFIKVKPDDATTNNPRVTMTFRVEADSHATGSNIVRYLGFWDIGDTVTQWHRVHIEVPIKLRFLTQLYVKCTLDSVESAAIKDLHLFARALGTIAT